MILPPLKSSEIVTLLDDYQTYAQARQHFLLTLKLPTSCRDPLAEMSEVLVARVLGAIPAPSRVQKDYDLIDTNNRYVQVKYLANTLTRWVNEHHIQFTGAIDDYALVILTSLQVESVIIFQRETIAEVCQLLQKRHPLQTTQLQFTQRNYHYIRNNLPLFQAKGVRFYQFEAPVQVAG